MIRKISTLLVALVFLVVSSFAVDLSPPNETTSSKTTKVKMQKSDVSVKAVASEPVFRNDLSQTASENTVNHLISTKNGTNKATVNSHEEHIKPPDIRGNRFDGGIGDKIRGQPLN